MSDLKTINLDSTDAFASRHIGPNQDEINYMLRALGYDSLDAMIDATVPETIRLRSDLNLPAPLSEYDALSRMKTIASANKVFRSFIGMGYYDCITPPVIQRNILENPGWYTQYTPYQAEIAQGRLEALLNYQTMVIDLTGLPIANASMLDEATAAAEAMLMSHALKGKNPSESYFVSSECFPQTIHVVQTRAEVIGVTIITGDHRTFDFQATPVFGALVQYPAGDGTLHPYDEFVQNAHANNAMVTVATDLLALAMLRPPGEFGADIAIGNSQRFGVPLGYGGPHAAFFATKEDFKRHIPGRIIGVSADTNGRPALRMALQTREQHIRREKATSNICTAQVLLAVMAGMYAVYHGPEGILNIARRVHDYTGMLAAGLIRLGYGIASGHYFDTLRVQLGDKPAAGIIAAAASAGMNLRMIDATTVGVSLDETIRPEDLSALLHIFNGGQPAEFSLQELVDQVGAAPDTLGAFRRTSPYLTHPVFNTHHSETEMLRYMRMLESRDLSLTTSMIPLGSCTMKLNATAEMYPVTWSELGRIHPYAPDEQTEGYRVLFGELENALSEITGFPGVSLQPNAGSQGEYAGLLVIRAWHLSRNQGHRHVCLIPQSAHGTNPASAVMAGMKVVVVATDPDGNIDIADLRLKAEAHKEDLAALMVTYPSTHGVFEEGITEICSVVHQYGGQVYMDGANMNAQVGLCRPGDFGADVCHLNLHKTFCIPHGGGGPGMGPICVAEHLKSFLPAHPVDGPGGATGNAIGPVSAAPYGSSSILPISYMYILMMGGSGLTMATKIAILNANYMAGRLQEHFPVLYKGTNGLIAHECIVDMRSLKTTAGIEVEDIAKRLMDYGYHAPTVSFPVAGTMMIEPTESESLHELDQFCDALIAIRQEIRDIENGVADKTDNVLKNAPHTAQSVTADTWGHPYSRRQAAYPSAFTHRHKFWPSVGRVNNAAGDRNLVCACPPIEAYIEDAA